VRTKIVTAVAAGVLGISGLALAGPALAATGTPGATAVSSGVDRVKQALAGLVTDKTLTQAQADKVAATLAPLAAGPGGPGGGRGGGPGGHGPGGGPDLGTAATTLKMTEADLRTALDGGKTLAQVAQGKGVSTETLVAALVKAETARIAQEVTDKKITQAQADERLATLSKQITERVTTTRPARPKGDPQGGPQGGPAPAPSASASAN
jgi:hypothetical protein